MISSPVTIDSVPNEILLMVFLEFRHEPNLESPPSADVMKSNARAILAASHVCQRWRDLCLKFGMLWSSAIDVTSNKLPWARRLTRRAKDVPVVIHTNSRTICAYAGQTFRSGAWAYILEHPTCWGTLSVDRVCVCTDKSMLTAALTQPAPNLERFKIHITLKHTVPRHRLRPLSRMPPVRENFMALPDNLFGGQAPRLREFSIENVQLLPHMDFSAWKNLRVLHVKQYPYPYIFDHESNSAFMLSARDWLNVLGGMLQLEQLYLGWQVGDFPSDSESDSDLPDVHLDHLSKLELMAGCEWNILLDVFGKLVVPSDCSTIVTLDNVEEKLSFEQLQIGLDRRVQKWLNITNGRFHVDLRNIAANGVFSFEVAIHDPSDKSPKFPNLEFHYKTRFQAISGDRPRPVYPCASILQMLGHFPVFGLSIEIPKIHTFDKRPLRRFLAKCKTTNEATFKYTDPKILEFLQGSRASSTSVASKSATKQPPVVFPHLHSLLFIVEFGQSILAREMYEAGFKLKSAGQHPRLRVVEVYYG